jgi:hypothetical protein
VNPRSRLSWTLAISLLLWLPVAYQVLQDQIDLPIGGLYYLIALALAWVGSGIVLTIISGYLTRARLEAQRALKEIRDIERRHRREALEQRQRERQALAANEGNHDDSDSDSDSDSDHYDDDAPAMPRPRRSDDDE